MADIVKLAEAAVELTEENTALRAKLAAADEIIRNLHPIVKAFYDAMASNTVTDAATFYGFVSARLGSVDAIAPLPPAESQ